MIDHTLRPVLLLDGKIVNYVNLELRIKVDDGDDVVLTHFNAERARMAQLEAALEDARPYVDDWGELQDRIGALLAGRE